MPGSGSGMGRASLALWLLACSSPLARSETQQAKEWAAWASSAAKQLSGFAEASLDILPLKNKRPAKLPSWIGSGSGKSQLQEEYQDHQKRSTCANEAIADKEAVELHMEKGQAIQAAFQPLRRIFNRATSPFAKPSQPAKRIRSPLIPKPPPRRPLRPPRTRHRGGLVQAGNDTNSSAPSPTSPGCRDGFMAFWRVDSISCGANGNLTIDEFEALSRKDGCNVTGAETCLCPYDSADVFQSADTGACLYSNPVTCRLYRKFPNITCPPKQNAEPYGDPVCFPKSRTDSFEVGLTLNCSSFYDKKNFGSVISKTPTNEQMESWYIRNENSGTGKPAKWYVEKLGTYYDQMKYDFPQMKVTSIDNYPLDPIPKAASVNAWDFNRLSETISFKSDPLDVDQLNGDKLITIEVDLGKVPDTHMVGGRVFLEATPDHVFGSGLSKPFQYPKGDDNWGILVDIDGWSPPGGSPPSSVPLWVWIVVGAILLLLIIAIVDHFRRQRKEKKQNEEKRASVGLFDSDED